VAARKIDASWRRHAGGDAGGPDADGGSLDRADGPRRGRVRRRILRSTSLLPALLTIGNGLLGFGAIHVATRPVAASQPAAGQFAAGLTQLCIAAYLIFAAMVCDVLDGRVARWTRRSTDFGGQLDSLCDAVSFGVAPAVLVLRGGALALGEIGRGPVASPEAMVYLGRAVWACAAVYAACALLRLARFNVENRPDEAAHMDFSGLPSPGAAAAVATLVLLFAHLVQKAWARPDWVLRGAAAALPAAALALGLLMVSRFPYPHVLNRYIRGRRPFGWLVTLVVLVVAAVLEVFVAGVAVATAYALSGPARALWRRLHGRARGDEPS